MNERVSTNVCNDNMNLYVSFQRISDDVFRLGMYLCFARFDECILFE